ncbi:hypothetical protein V8E36_008303 [Tilletia maclaganii]
MIFHNPASGRRRKTFLSRALVTIGAAAVLALSSSASAAGANAQNFPAIDFDALGALSVVGNFVGLEIFNSTADVQQAPLANASSLVARASNGTLTTIGSTNANATINAVATGSGGSGTAPLVYVGGNFTSIGGQTASRIAAYDPASRTWDDMNGGLDGTVHALYYSAEHKALLAGGSFRAPTDVGDQSEAYLGSVALWDEVGGAWRPLNFGGLNGTVFGIDKGFDPSFIRFAGSFLALYGNGQNATSDTMSSPSSLSRVLQPYSLAMAQLSGGPPSQSPDYNNAAQILCPQGPDGPGNTYLWESEILGLLTVETFRVLEVAAIRLGNTQVDGRGLRGFSIVSLPDNQVLELVYRNPTTGANVTCSDNCILSHRDELAYQDFLISPAQGGSKVLTGIQLRVNSFYGAGAGLHILELLSDGAWTWANNALNRGRCSSSEPGVNGTRSITRHVGDWDFTSVSRGLGPQQPILEFTDSIDNLQTGVQNNVSVDFSIDIPVDGNYTGYLSVPGCLADGSCGRRTQALVTVYPTSNRSVSFQTYVSQTVEQDSTIKIFDGEIIGSQAESIEGASTFMPVVVLAIAPNATLASNQREFTIVADKVAFQLRNSNQTTPMSGPGFAFGLFEFDVFNSSAALPQNVNTTLVRSVAPAVAPLPMLGSTAVENPGLSSAFESIVASLSLANQPNAAARTNRPRVRQASEDATTTTTTSVDAASPTAAPGNSTNSTSSAEYQTFALDLVLPSYVNTTQTALDRFATTLFEAGLNGSFSFNNTDLGLPAQSIHAVADAANFIFVGGNFTSLAPPSSEHGFSNIVGFNVSSNGSNITRLAGGGLNNRVLAMAGVDNILYVGGAFTGLANDANSSVVPQYFGKYDVLANSWLPTDSALDGPVTSLTILPNSTLLLTGAFTTAGDMRRNGAFALYNTSSGTWIQEAGLIAGTVNAAAFANDDSDGTNRLTTYLAGPVGAVSDFSVPGAARIEPAKTDDEFPIINALGFAFQRTPASGGQGGGSNSSSSVLSNGTIAFQNGTLVAPNGTVLYQPSRRQVRSAQVQGSGSGSESSVVRRLADKILQRAVERLEDREAERARTSSRDLHIDQQRASAIEPEILMSPNGTNEIYASAFWSRSDGSYLQILGGQFTTSTNVTNLGAYDPDTKSLNPFPALSPTLANFTTVRALLVIGDQLFVGGDGGIASYNFVTAQWDNTTTPLSSDSEQQPVVRTIVHRPDTSELYVGGAFDNAGSLPCSSICVWDNSQLRWNPLGTSLDGDVAVLDFAGPKASTLIAAGNLEVENTPTPLASYDTTRNIWVALGSVGDSGNQAPGAATAMSVDNLQLNSIFIGGRSSDDTSAYLAKWDGARYVGLGNDELQPATGIQQLTFVPILRAHGGNSILENNRLLVVSGLLQLANFGNVSSAFFDGATWQPFLLGAGSSNGSPGIVRAVVRATEVLKFSNFHRLAVGIVILISIAIGLGLVFLLTLLGLLWAMARRNKNKGVVDAAPPISAQHEVPGDEYPGRPSSLLATLNAATENVMGAGAGSVGRASQNGGAAPASGGPGSHFSAAGAAGVGAGAAGATSSGHGRTDSGPLNTIENSDETGGGPSTAYHSEGAQTGRSGASQYFTDEEAAGAAGAGAAAAAAAGAGMAGGEGIPARARYSFEATHESELSMHAGDQITILDDLDEHWWLARDSSGREGVVPSTYVL